MVDDSLAHDEFQQNEPLHQFFAVTVSGSVYEVNDHQGPNGWPEVVRIFPEDNRQFYLQNGHLVGITDIMGIILFNAIPGERRPEMINTMYYGGHTSKIVALFVDESAARDCQQHTDLKYWDERWEAQTDEVLRRIGSSHPVFVIDGYYRNSSADLRQQADRIFEYSN